MRISKDLADAISMLTSVCLVLISTTEFENTSLKTATMGGLILLTAAMIVARIFAARRQSKQGDEQTYAYES